ncbi:MAG: hypothetical protein Q8M31_15330 [Beijerinckiaceae bacterium]|nr:hypothetical protein [Beijerinckiaceae bacterium]
MGDLSHETKPTGAKADRARWLAAAKRLAHDAATSIPLTAAVYVASGSIPAGVAVAAIVLALRPVFRACAARARQFRS